MKQTPYDAVDSDPTKRGFANKVIGGTDVGALFQTRKTIPDNTIGTSRCSMMIASRSAEKGIAGKIGITGEQKNSANNVDIICNPHDIPPRFANN